MYNHYHHHYTKQGVCRAKEEKKIHHDEGTLNTVYTSRFNASGVHRMSSYTGAAGTRAL